VYSFLYGLSNFILAYAWYKLIRLSHKKKLDKYACTRIYARSIIAKYLPGNVFHIAGRHYLGIKEGIPSSALIYSAILELAGAVLAAAVVSSVGAISYIIDNYASLAISILAIIFLSLYVLSLTIKLLQHIPRTSLKILSNDNALTITGKLSPILFLHILFFLVSGILIVSTLALLTDIDNLRIVGITITVYASSWILGFITPGAPGGVGVREAIMIAGLRDVIGETESIILSILSRIVTTLGDVIFFVMGLLMKDK